MKKIKYYYNTNTLRYEKLEIPLRVTLLRILGFMSASIVTALILVSLAYRYFPSANEKRLMQYIMTKIFPFLPLYFIMKCFLNKKKKNY